MRKLILSRILFCYTLLLFSNVSAQKITNPLFDGFFAADPSIIFYEGNYYIYATIDPWGGDELAVFETPDFINYKQNHLNWPTKKECTSPTSNSSMVWAPSVVKGKDGRFYMYVSVGSEVWAGVSEHPLGPWKNLKQDNSPLVKGNALPGFHMIDAECFIDENNQAYLYWGSGWDWVNGHCFVVKLKSDMVSFNDEPLDITPPNYFEGPFMLKRNGLYYLMYSEGKCTDPTYKVRYSISKTPLGPWTEGVNSPILSTSKDSLTYGPGHHTVFNKDGQDYILYHRIVTQKKESLHRQLCIDSLNYDSAGNIKIVVPQGVYFRKQTE